MNRKGFTLIELVIVIVIIGILAAVAIPRFAGFTKEAKISAVKGFAGSLRAAANIVHAKWLVDDNNSDKVNVEGDNVTVDNSSTVAPGYPLATNEGILQAIRFDNKTFVPLTNDNDNITFKLDNQSGCSVIYYYNGGTTGNGAAAAPKVTIDTSKCR